MKITVGTDCVVVNYIKVTSVWTSRSTEQIIDP